MSKTPSKKSFSELAAIMATLRGPQGCPWDREQTHASLLPYLFSEAEEVKEAVENRDWENLEEELGDILLQVLFHSQIATEAGRFTIDDVIHGIAEKLTRRHPHVFGSKKLSTPEEVYLQWEQIKKQEKKDKASKKKKSPSARKPHR